jgi:two-component system NtrC family response regulator
VKQSKGDGVMKNRQQKENREESTAPRYVLELANWEKRSSQQLIVCVDLPGLEDQQLDIQLAGNLLIIKPAAPIGLDLQHLERSQIVGDSPALQSCLDQVARAAECDDSVLIYGETGTGKELIARAVHQNSCRDGENFVVVDCRSIPESIAAKLLLGQVRNARQGHRGLLAEAERGTLFLDEIADLPATIQNLFRKLLQKRSYRPVGELSERGVGFRLVAATNHDLDQLTADGKFNPELLTLLQSVIINVPPLRERHGDIEPLTDFFLQHFYQSEQLDRKELSPEFKDVLNNYSWPGNVRELKNSLGQALLAAANKKTLFPKDLPAHIRVQVKKLAFAKQHKLRNNKAEESFFGGLLIADNPL